MSQELFATSLGCQTIICYPLKSSLYEIIRNIRELDAYLTHHILSKFSNHAHILVGSAIKRLGDGLGHLERLILTEVLLRVVILEDLRSIWKGLCESGSV